MPLYEYKCEDCGRVSEVLVRNTVKQGEVACNVCGSLKTNRIISVPGAVRSKDSFSASEMPPISCPNQGKCGMPYSSCPAAQHH